MEGAEILEEAQSHQWLLLVLSSPDTGTEHEPCFSLWFDPMLLLVDVLLTIARF